MMFSFSLVGSKDGCSEFTVSVNCSILHFCLIRSGAGELDEMGMGYSVLDWVCIGTAVLASVPPL
jgi:hypothetical protein